MAETTTDDRERMTLRIPQDIWRMIKMDLIDKKEKSANELITNLIYEHYKVPRPQ
ncbi:hypothetical protein SBF1_50031 [Candidatus Desulfosporosinus infrequens]|uniref:CopG-like ribbon-helix-helix domain-containing protein n=1 Tax=Candidatus Desulfosporosinus infrequens TaxID=2043169 RepID=A0A2U3LGR6_9FIRM|nr:hypothetical protein SBF1_50031 [Candidatus Desulfosporosinus infrequens]